MIVEILGLSGFDVGHYATAELLLPTQYYMAEDLQSVFSIVKPLDRNILRPTAHPHSLKIEQDVLDQLHDQDACEDTCPEEGEESATS